MARPKSLDAKRNRLELRLNDVELSYIDAIAHQCGLSRSEAVIAAIEFKYNAMEDFLRDNPALRK